MNLQGQLDRRDGYAMVALLVAMSVMAVLMSAAMPTWRQLAQREKEAELIFRGQQYARAIGLFQRRAGPGANPPNLDILVQQRFLRKKYKDPITGQDFDLISPVTAVAAPTAPGQAGRGQTTTPGQPAAPGGGFRATVGPTPGGGGFRATGAAPGATVAAQGGIVGVASKSKEKSIRIYNGRNYYNEWQFIYVPQTQQPGGAGAPRGRGLPGQQPIEPGGGRGGFDLRGRGTQPGAPGRGGPTPPQPGR